MNQSNHENLQAQVEDILFRLPETRTSYMALIVEVCKNYPERIVYHNGEPCFPLKYQGFTESCRRYQRYALEEDKKRIALGETAKYPLPSGVKHEKRVKELEIREKFRNLEEEAESRLHYGQNGQGAMFVATPEMV